MKRQIGSILLQLKEVVHNAVSFKGRTTDFDSVNVGSIPAIAAKDN